MTIKCKLTLRQNIQKCATELTAPCSCQCCCISNITSSDRGTPLAWSSLSTCQTSLSINSHPAKAETMRGHSATCRLRTAPYHVTDWGGSSVPPLTYPSVVIGHLQILQCRLYSRSLEHFPRSLCNQKIRNILSSVIPFLFKLYSKTSLCNKKNLTTKPGLVLNTI